MIRAIAALVSALGPWWTLVVLLLLIAYHQLREWQKSKRENAIANEKEAQIQRLADDNRWMRRVLMKKAMGLSDAEIHALADQGPARPLLATTDADLAPEDET